MAEKLTHPNSISTKEPFKNLFPSKTSKLARIQANMAEKGFDESQPLIIAFGDWCETGVLIDGHTRLEAAKNIGIEDVPVVHKEFDSEEAALREAIRLQTDRRNLTDAELAACVRELDKRQPPKFKGNQYTKPESGKAPNGAQPESGKSSDDTAQLLGTSPRKVERVRTILDHGDDETKQGVLSGEKSINKGYEETQQRRSLVTVPTKKEQRPVFNFTNDNIEWAKWTWNPVTGCQHGCDYCYAREIALRFDGTFEPRFRENRLSAPNNTKVPEKAATNVGFRNVFVCSMADLFGEWVPSGWITKVLDACANSPQWNYIFLTKNPERMSEFSFPINSWVGTTIDTQARVERATNAFWEIDAPVKFISCEPMLEEINIPDISLFDWLIIGGQSKTRDCSAFQPKWGWVWKLTQNAVEHGLKVYWKPNLSVRPKEYPEIRGDE